MKKNNCSLQNRQDNNFIVLNVLSYGSQLMVLVLILLDPSHIAELSMEKTVTGICAYLIDGGTVPA